MFINKVVLRPRPSLIAPSNCNVRKKMRFALNKKNPSEEEQPSGAGDRKKRSFNKWNQLLFSKLNEPWRRCGNTALISWQSSRLKLTFNLLMNGYDWNKPAD